MSLQGKDKLTQRKVNKLQAQFQSSQSQGFEISQFESLTESDQSFLKILANLYESAENSTMENFINDVRLYAKELFTFHLKQSSQLEELQKEYKQQRKCVQKLNIMIEEYKIANEQLRNINFKNQNEYQQEREQFEYSKKILENSKKELEQNERINQQLHQIIHGLKSELDSQKEVNKSFEKENQVHINQIKDLKQKNIQLISDNQRLHTILKDIQQQYQKQLQQKQKQIQIIHEEALNQHYAYANKWAGMKEECQSVCSIKSITKEKDNIATLKQAENLNDFDRKLSIEAEDFDSVKNLDIIISSENSSKPSQYSERDNQSNNTESKHQKTRSGIPELQKKKSLNMKFKSDKTLRIRKKQTINKSSQLSQNQKTKKIVPKQSEQQQQKRLLKENLSRKQKQLNEIKKKFQKSQSDNYVYRIQLTEKGQDLALVRGQYELIIQELTDKAEHEKKVTKKFMKENIDLKLKNTRLIEALKQLYSERDNVEKYYSQYFTQKCKQLIKEKSHFLEQRTSQVKESLEMLMQYYKKWIVEPGKNQVNESTQQKNKRIQLQTIILKLNGGDISTIKKVRFKKSKLSKTRKKSNEDSFKDEPTGDITNAKIQALFLEPLSMVKLEGICIAPKQIGLSRSPGSFDQNIQVLSEMQLSLTFDEDIKLQSKINHQDSMIQSTAKKETDKTANQTPDKELQESFAQTEDIQFREVVKKLSYQDEGTTNLYQPKCQETQVSTIEIQDFAIQVDSFEINSHLNSQSGMQTVKNSFNDQVTQTQTHKNEARSQAQPDSQAPQTTFNQIQTEQIVYRLQFTQTEEKNKISSISQTQQLKSSAISSQTILIQYCDQEQQTQQRNKKSTVECQTISNDLQSLNDNHQDKEVKQQIIRYCDFGQQTQLFINQTTQTQLHFQLFDFSLQTQNPGFGKVPLTEEQFLSIQTKTKGSKIDIQSVVSSEGFHQELQQKQQLKKWKFYNPQNTKQQFFQPRLDFKQLKKVQKQRSPRPTSKTHRVEKDQSSSLIIDVNQVDCKQLPVERVLEKLASKPIGSIMFTQKFQQVKNSFKWNKDQYYMIEAQSEKDGLKEKFLVWRKGIFSLLSRKYLKLKVKGLCFADPEMINIGNSEIVLKGQQVLIRKKQKNCYVTGKLQNGTWKIMNCSVYDCRK